jgi:molecular chaperone DnaK (HSP70)
VRCIEVEQETLEGKYTHTLVPSVVAFHEGRVLVGEGAKRLRLRAGELGLELYRDIFWDCKNLMGVRRTFQKAP